MARVKVQQLFSALACRICLEPGRWVCNDAVHLIPTQGAYTYSLRQNFIKPLPTVLTI